MSTLAKTFIFVVAIILPFSSYIADLILPRNDWWPWYSALVKPPFNPPGIVFAIVWPILYASIGLASYWVYDTLVKAGKGFDQNAQLAAVAYAIQLLLNWAWPAIFFRLHELGLVRHIHLIAIKWESCFIPNNCVASLFSQAAIGSTVLWFAILINTYVFGRINKAAGLLFLPYLAWGTFATYLSWAFYKLNNWNHINFY